MKGYVGLSIDINEVSSHDEEDAVIVDRAFRQLVEWFCRGYTNRPPQGIGLVRALDEVHRRRFPMLAMKDERACRVLEQT